VCPYLIHSLVQLESNVMSDPNPDKLPLSLSIVGAFLFAIAIIIGGYIKGNMHIETVYHNLTHFN